MGNGGESPAQKKNTYHAMSAKADSGTCSDFCGKSDTDTSQKHSGGSEHDPYEYKQTMHSPPMDGTGREEGRVFRATESLDAEMQLLPVENRHKTVIGSDGLANSQEQTQQNHKKRKGEAFALTGQTPKLPHLSHKQTRKQKMKEKKQLINMVKLWSGNAKDVVKRARKVCSLKSWQPEQFRFHCPVPGCQTRFPSQEVRISVFGSQDIPWSTFCVCLLSSLPVDSGFAHQWD